MEIKRPYHPLIDVFIYVYILVINHKLCLLSKLVGMLIYFWSPALQFLSLCVACVTEI
jgi:hypothetical protein